MPLDPTSPVSDFIDATYIKVREGDDSDYLQSYDFPFNDVRIIEFRER